MHNIQTSIEQTPITISVILPVYNLAPWIGECIESLKKQTLPGLEFIFVDDCSTDGSRDIIEAFAAEDPRVRILQNEVNSGSGSSRNAGIEAARGEYYSFIDPDDWVCDDFYALLYAKAQETGCDIIKGVRVPFKDGDDISRVTTAKAESALNNRIRKLLKKNWPLYNGFTYEHQSAIFKSSLFADENVRYGSSRVAQDVTFLLKVCYNTTGIAFQEGAIYYYRRREGAATSGYTIKRAMAQMRSLKESAAYLKSMPNYPNQFHSAYLIETLYSTHNLYYYASKAETISPLSQEEYRQSISNLVESLVPSSQLARRLPEIEIFLDYKHCIPSAVKKGDIVFRDGIVQWTKFFKEHPEARNESYYKSYASAVLRTIASYYKARNEFPVSPKDGLQFANEQLSQLSWKDRRRVLTQIPPQGFSAILRRIGYMKP